MPSLCPSSCRLASRSLRVTAALVLAALAAGCWRPLAVQHEYFAPTAGSAAKTASDAHHAVSRYRALQAARRACAESMPAASASPVSPASRSGSATATASGAARGPDPGAAAAREALADLCAAPPRPPVAAYGGVSDAYRRWAEDRVRELPATSETAASAAGGS